MPLVYRALLKNGFTCIQSSNPLPRPCNRCRGDLPFPRGLQLRKVGERQGQDVSPNKLAQSPRSYGPRAQPPGSLVQKPAPQKPALSLGPEPSMLLPTAPLISSPFLRLLPTPEDRSMPHRKARAQAEVHFCHCSLEILAQEPKKAEVKTHRTLVKKSGPLQQPPVEGEPQKVWLPQPRSTT